MPSLLDMLERDRQMWRGDITIGQIALACALGYLDLRFPDEPWREGRPAEEGVSQKIHRPPLIPGNRPTSPDLTKTPQYHTNILRLFAKRAIFVRTS